MKGSRIPYEPEELAWIKARKDWTRADLHRAFCNFWQRGDVSFSNFKALCTRKGWSNGNTGRFEKGIAAHNKGKPMPFNANSAATRFQKGQRTGRANALYKPVGTERMAKDGYLERKIHDALPFHTRWRAVHLIRWEAVNGPVPAGHALKCLDGDRLNTDPENWFAIPRALLPRLAGRWHMPYDSAPAELKPVLLAIARVQHKAREVRQ